MKILVIDDEKSIRLSLKMGLEKLGLTVIAAETGEEGLKVLKNESPDLAIVDIRLPGIDGLEVLKHIKSIKPTCIVIMITYLNEIKLAVRAMKDGAYDYFVKPFSLNEIQQSIEQTLQYIRIKKEIDISTSNTLLIGNSEKIQAIRETIMKIGQLPYDTCILLEGESGTGKEVVAKLIHSLKVGDNHRFMAINCAAIPKNLQESELFGYEKGAFSDAKSYKAGLIEAANRGVLFLDEIADMDIELQAKMLRVLQEKSYRSVGGLKERKFEATIVAATNKYLLREIQRGTFREDLYYRLNIVPINLPPLRERREDIPILSAYFLDEYNKKLNKAVIGIDPDAMAVLRQYNWPGNVRQLRNMIERVMIFQKDEIIALKDIPKEIVNFIPKEPKPEDFNSLEIAEEAIIKKTLEKHDWNITRTAEDLGLSRLTLRRKIQKYKLSI